ncbi:MAG: RNA methyltransferase [Myxococcaceae bacterium]
MLSRIRIVLLGPKNPENVGAAARALKNFGVSDWALVRPAFDDLNSARRLAAQSHDVLESVRRADTLDEAVADCVWVVGTSSRRVRGKRSLAPRLFAEEAATRTSSGSVALVFGEESSGLSNDEVDRCHDLSSIPTSDDQPSLNLAQAVLLYCYELRLAARSEQGKPPAPGPALATDASLEDLQAAFADALRAHGFLRDPERHAVKDLFAPLRRARLSRNEARIWRSAVAALTHEGER